MATTPCTMPLEPPKRFQVPGGEILYNENRDNRFYYIYHVQEHPLVDRQKLPSDWKGRILVTIIDTSREAMKAMERFEDELHVPMGDDQSVIDLGWFEAHNDDILFGRDMYGEKVHGELDPCNDVVQFFVADGEKLVGQEIIGMMKEIQEEVLGPKEERGPDRPQRTDGVWSGGARFERNDQVSGIKDTRCYTIAQSFQFSKNLVSPVAAGKVIDNELTEEHNLRKKIAFATTSIGMASLKRYAPTVLLERLEMQAEVTNMIRVGCKDNCAFPTIQTNLAHPVAYDERTQKGLAKDMGAFGNNEGHRDGHDHPGGLTTMISNSDLPPGYQPGRFHLFSFGIFIKLDRLRAMSFSGLRKHGGTPPIAPQGHKVESWAYRLMFVLYPPSAMLDSAGKSMVAVAADVPGELLCASPEMTTLTKEAYQPIPRCSRTNLANDGPVLMDLEQLHKNFVRMVHCAAVYYTRQLPPALGARIDSRLFFEAFSRAAQLGEDITIPPNGDVPRVSCPDWPTAHTGYTRWMDLADGEDDPSMTEQDKLCIRRREEVLALWDEYVARTSKLIPFIACKSVPKADDDRRRAGPTQGKKTVTKAGGGQRNRRDKGAIDVPEKETVPLATYFPATQAVENVMHMEGGFAVLREHSGQQARGPPGPSRRSSRQLKEKNGLQSHVSSRGQSRVPSRVQSRTQSRVPSRAPSPDSEGQTEARQAKRRRLNFNPDLEDEEEIDDTSSQYCNVGGRQDNDPDYDDHEDYDMDRMSYDEEDNAGPQHGASMALSLHKALPGAVAQEEEMDDEDYYNEASFLPAEDDSEDKDDSDEGDENSEDELDDNLIDETPLPENFSDNPGPCMNQYLSTMSLWDVIDDVQRSNIANITSTKEPSTSPSETSITIQRLIEGVANQTMSESTMGGVRTAWDHLASMNKFEKLSAMETRNRRLMIMFGTWAVWRWLTAVMEEGMGVCDQIGTTSNWIGSLCQKVYRMVSFDGPFGAEHIFLASDFIKSGGVEGKCIIQKPRQLRDSDRQKEQTEKLVLEVLMTWTNLPKDGDSVNGVSCAQYAFVDNVLALKLPESIFLLDGIWKVFERPRSLMPKNSLLEKRASRQAIPYRNMQAAVKQYIGQNAIAQPGTAENHLLHILHGMHHEGRNRPEIHTTTYMPSSPPQPSSSGHKIFLSYLREVAILLRNHNPPELKSNKRLAQVAKKRDHLLPFRDVAPTRVKSIEIIYSNPEYLRTRVGIWNVLIFRAVFYGAPFALNDLRTFDSLDEWNAFYQETLNKLGEDGTKKYFVNSSAYGTPNPHRNVGCIAELWETSKKWTDFLTRFPSPSFEDAYNFFVGEKPMKVNFLNVGSLTALLIAGDLVAAEVISMCDVETLGDIIWSVDKGAVNAFKTLQLIGVGAKKPQMISAFIALYNYLSTELSDEEKREMKFSYLMLEHGLCKYGRYCNLTKGKKKQEGVQGKGKGKKSVATKKMNKAVSQIKTKNSSRKAISRK